MPVNPEWKSFLAARGARIEEAGRAAFGEARAEVRAAAHGNVVCALSHLSLIRAQGADALTFLNGQLTNDLRLVDDSRSQLSGYCTAKGRLLAVFRIFQRAQAYYLIVPASLQEATIKRLRMFVLRSKVALESADDALVCIGCSGPDIAPALERALGDLPPAVDGCRSHNDTSVLRLAGPHPRFFVVAPAARAIELWQAIEPAAQPAGAAAWAWLDIQSGLPSVLPQTVEEFVPQNTNLELIGGVSFKKGCYPGQEIVARMHYLGKPKQRMFRLHAAADVQAHAGDRICAPDFPGQSAGVVVDAQPSPDHGTDLLAVVQLSSVAGGVLHLRAADGPGLATQRLPYELEPKS